MKKRAWFLVIILILLVISSSAFLIFRFDLLKKFVQSSEEPSPEINEGNENNQMSDNLLNTSKNEILNNANKTSAPPKSGGGGGGGGSSGSPASPPVIDKCVGVTCDDGYICGEGICNVTKTICLIAQQNDICDGLNIAYGDGYEESCYSKYGLC